LPSTDEPFAAAILCTADPGKVNVIEAVALFVL
jgi:hypothetical protein